MGAIIPIAGATSPVERLLQRFDRAQLEGFISIAIELLDLADGDNDVESNGDELDGTGGEDDFIDRGQTLCGLWSGAGCPVSDPGGGNCEDEGEAVNEDGVEMLLLVTPNYGADQSEGPLNQHEASREWQTRQMQKRGE